MFVSSPFLDVTATKSDIARTRKSCAYLSKKHQRAFGFLRTQGKRNEKFIVSCEEAPRKEHQLYQASEPRVVQSSSTTSTLVGEDHGRRTSLADTNIQAKESGHDKKLGIAAAYMLLNVVAIMWGSQHAVIKYAIDGWSASPIAGDVVHGFSPAELNSARFLLSAIVCTPALLFSNKTKEESRNPALPSNDSLWRSGAELGFWMFAGYALQSIGLQFTSASRSAFLLYLNVKLVPFLGMVLFGKKIGISTWISAAIAVVGTMLLSVTNGDLSLNIGDGFSIMAAAASAMFILRLEAFAPRFEPAKLNAVSLWSNAAFSGAWLLGSLLPSFVSGATDWSLGSTWEQITHMDVSQVSILLYLGVVTTAFTNWAQTIGQTSVSAEKAALIYAMDPVYAAAFAYFFLGESLGPIGMVGASLIGLAAVFSRHYAYSEKAEPNSSKTPN